MSGNSLEKVLVWDAVDLPPSADGTTVLWRGFADGAADNVVSIPRRVEENSDALRARYLAWVYDLGELRIQGRRLVDHLQLRPGFSYWWMTLLVEKCNYSKSPQIDDAIRLLAFTDWAAGRALGRITLASASRPLAECMRRWCEKSGIPFAWQPLPRPAVHLSWVRRAYAALPLAVQALAWVPRYLWGRWALRGAGLDEWRQTDGRITFVSYLFNLVPAAAQAGQYESRYWAHLPDALQHAGCKTNWLHLYVPDALLPGAGSAAEAIRAFNKHGRGAQRHVTLDAFLTARFVLKSLRDWAGLAWAGWRLERIFPSCAKDVLEFWPLFSEDWRQSTGGVAAFSNVLNLNLFEAAMQSLPKQQVGVYLQENQGWEYCLIHAWRAAGHGRLIGTPHSSVRFWDLRYFFDPRNYGRAGNCPLPLPDHVALNGKSATDAYLAGGYPAEDLIQVEALRYLYLADAGTRPPADSVAAKNGFQLLVLGDILPANTRLQMRFLEQSLRSLPVGMTITVKPHPACQICAEDYPDLRMTIVMEPIEKLLAECDAAYTSALTSAAADAYCTGVPVVSVLDASTLNLSPLRGKAGVFYASTPGELAGALRAIASAPRAAATKQDFFTIDRELPRWRNLLVGAG